MNESKIDIDNLSSRIDKYLDFSCKPTNKKYKEGTIFDEEQSVRWNKEELERRNLAHEEEVKKLNQEKNRLYMDIVAVACDYIKQELKFRLSSKRARKIWDYIYEEYSGLGEVACVEELDKLLDLFREDA